MKFVKIKNSTLLFLLLMAVLVMGIGYASINSVTGEIKGTLTANSQEGVFITDVTYVSDVGADKMVSQINNYTGTVMDSTIKLSDTNVSSSITYKVTVYNDYSYTMTFSEVAYDNNFYDNKNIDFEITGFKPGDTIGAKETKDIIITFKYKGSTIPSNKVLNSYLNFKMIRINRMVSASVNTVKGKYLNSEIDEDKIEAIEFKLGKVTDINAEIKSSFDASELQDKSIMGYYTDADNNGLYELTFISESIIYSNINCGDLFSSMTALEKINFDNFNTFGATAMQGIFFGCEKITSIDLKNFDVSQVENFYTMFAGCKSIVELDLTGFDTAKANYMLAMFYQCTSLTTIYVSEYDSNTGKGWKDSDLENTDMMFAECINLVGGNGTKYDENIDDNGSYARIDKTGSPGYLTSGREKDITLE